MYPSIYDIYPSPLFYPSELSAYWYGKSYYLFLYGIATWDLIEYLIVYLTNQNLSLGLQIEKGASKYFYHTELPTFF